MNRSRYLFSSLKYHWKSYFLLCLAIAVSTAVMVGAMLVGYSMKKSLEDSKQLRLGKVQQSLFGGDRFLTEGLVQKLSKASGQNLVGLIQLPGSVKNQGSGRSLPRVVVNAIDESFWGLAPHENDSKTGGVSINETLAKRLGLKAGDTLLLKMNIDPMGDSVMSQSEIELEAMELKIDRVLNEASWGNFNLASNQLPPYNLFVPLEQIQELLEKEGRVNLILSDGSGDAKQLKQHLDQSLSLEDLEFELEPLEKGFELRSPRIFLERDLNGLEAPTTLFTYLVTEVAKDDAATPYPLVVGIEHPDLPIAEDEVVLTDWMAEDLNAKVGDLVSMGYHTLNDQNMLLSKQAEFKVKQIVPVKSRWLDDKMMPDYPGLKDSEHCRDWDVGFEINLEKIREKDEHYWDTYKGRPKALISLKAAQTLWQNRYGDKTALRFNETSKEVLTQKIKSKLKSDFFGLVFIDNIQAAEQALAGSMDFSGLFMGFSFFIFIAILSLTYLLFRFLIEERKGDHHLLSALGFDYSFVKKQFIWEFLIVSLPGSVLGMALGYLYTGYLIDKLNGKWQDSIGVWNLQQAVSLSSILIGVCIGIGLTFAILWVSLKHLKKNFQEFGQLSSTSTAPLKAWQKSLAWVTYVATGLVGVKLFFSTQGAPKLEFFLFGFLLLASLLLYSFIRLSAQAKRGGLQFSRWSLMFSQMGRRKARSLAVIMMLSCGAFMMISLEVFRMAPDVDTQLKSSGSGGFQLMVDFTRDLDRDLNLESTQKRFALQPEVLKGTGFFPMRKSPGEDASCLNLNRAQRPNLYGIDSEEFAQSTRFSFASSMSEEGSPWRQLQEDLGTHKVAVIGDQNALLYSLGKGVGSSMTIKNERGEDLELYIVGGIQNSIFQSSLLMDDKMLLRHFPSIAGFQTLMVETPDERLESVQAELNEGLELLGADAISTQEKMMSYNRVQNSYISIFQTLGLLGLVLGCSGLCLIVIHNIQDREDEFGVLSALGQSQQRIQQDLLKEHLFLFVSGLLFGFFSGWLATWPILSRGMGDLQVSTLLTWLIVMLVIGVASILFGYRFSAAKLSLMRKVEFS